MGKKKKPFYSSPFPHSSSSFSVSSNSEPRSKKLIYTWRENKSTNGTRQRPSEEALGWARNTSSSRGSDNCQLSINQPSGIRVPEASRARQLSGCCPWLRGQHYSWCQGESWGCQAWPSAKQVELILPSISSGLFLLLLLIPTSSKDPASGFSFS